MPFQGQTASRTARSGTLVCMTLVKTSPKQGLSRASLKKRWTLCLAALCFQGLGRIDLPGGSRHVLHLAPRKWDWSHSSCHKMKQASKRKCLLLLPGSASSRNSVVILDCTEEDKQVYQIFGKRDVSRTYMVQRRHGQNSHSPPQKECKNHLSGWGRFKDTLSIKMMKKKMLEVRCVT